MTPAPLDPESSTVNRSTPSEDTMTTPRGEWAPEFVERIAGLEGIHFDHADPSPEAIAAMDALGVPMGPREAGDLSIEDIEITGPHGAVSVRVYMPREASDRSGTAFIWVHGGGFVAGDLDMPEADEAARGIAARSGAHVYSVDYRLCVDGVHHPVPHDDCWAVFRALAERADEWGIDPSRIAIGGASAGGNLAASVALRAKEEGVPLAFAALIYPVLHPNLPEPSAELAACLARTPDAIRFPPAVTTMLNENLLGGPVSSATPLAYPGLANDLSGFAPTYIETSEFDDLRSSGERFAEQLRHDGVRVDYVVAAGVPHGHLNTVGSPYASASFARIARRLADLASA
jgi:acetyl esterase